MLPNFKHAFDGAQSTDANVFGHFDNLYIVLQCVECVFECDFVHVGASDTTQAHHFFVGVFCGDVVGHAAFGKE